jgi:riboflavin synthase
MFTGIIEEVGEVVEARDGLLRIRARRILEDTKLGDSIAVDGVDLTVSEIEGGAMRFQVMPETFRQTTLGRLREGARVNLERSLRAGDRLSGHIVRGVVEGTGALASRRDDAGAVIMTFRAPEPLLANIVERGPVCVDGVSLTVIAKSADTFSVSVVDYTQANTTLLDYAPGEPVNLETDILMRYVSQAIEARGLGPADDSGGAR